MSSLHEYTQACVDSEYSIVTLTALAVSLEIALQQLPRSRFLELESELGRDPFLMITVIRDAADPVVRIDTARLLAALSDNCACSGDAPPEPTFAQEEESNLTLGKRAVSPVLWAIQQKYLS